MSKTSEETLICPSYGHLIRFILLHPFDEHFYHSAQFRGDYWQQQNYWGERVIGR